MKNIFFLLIASLLIVQCTPTKVVDNGNKTNPGPIAQPTGDGGTLDRSIPPSAGPAPSIQIGDYDKFTLDNGVEVIVVTNDKLPRVSFSLQLDVDPMLEGDKAGVVDLTGQLMRRGTKKRSKAQLDEEVDFIGASLSTSGSGVFASSLTKHQDKLLDLMSDVLLNSTFNEAELDKLKKQTISGLAAQKDNPNAISGNVANILNYSKNHPYGEITTEETVGNVTRDDCVEYYKSYFRPNTTRMVIVGDVDKKALKGQLEKYFGDWKEGKVPKSKYKTPAAPKTAEVAFVDKPGAVQSVITITYPVDYTPGSPEAIKARVMNQLLGGGGFAGRLMQNLREDKAYTYGAYSALNADELVGEFSASASVRNEVTDSAVVQFLYEMRRMRTEKVAQDDLNKILNKLTGSFSRALERPETVARFAQNIEKYNLPKDYYKNYLKNLRAVTVKDIQDMAKKYLTPDNAHILIVGNKDEVAPKLAKFSKSGKVNFFDTEGNPVEDKEIEMPNDVSAESVIENYIKAIGGRDALNAVEDATIELSMSMQGMSLDALQQFKTGEKFSLVISMMGNPVMAQKFDGEQMFANGKGTAVEAEKAKELKLQAMIAPEVAYGKMGFETELKGIEKVDGKDTYKVLVTSPTGNKTTSYYDVKTSLKVKEITITADGPDGQSTTATSIMGDYKKVEAGFMYPHKIKQSVGPQTFDMEIKSIKVNSGLTDDIFGK